MGLQPYQSSIAIFSSSSLTLWAKTSEKIVTALSQVCSFFEFSRPIKPFNVSSGSHFENSTGLPLFSPGFTSHRQSLFYCMNSESYEENICHQRRLQQASSPFR